MSRRDFTPAAPGPAHHPEELPLERLTAARARRIRGLSVLSILSAAPALVLIALGNPGGILDEEWASLLVVVPVVTAVLAFFNAARAQNSPVRKPWILVALGLILWAVAGLTAAALYTNSNLSSFAVSDLIFLAAYLLLFIGIAKMPFPSESVWTRRRLFVDITAGSLGMVLVIWYVVWLPYIAPRLVTDLAGALIDSFYLVADAVLLVFVTMLLARRNTRRPSNRLLWLALLLATTAVGDLSYLVANSTSSFSASSSTTALWVGTYIMIAVTATVLCKPIVFAEARTRFSWLRFALPYTGVAALLVVPMTTPASPGVKLLNAGIWVVAGLIIARQYFAIRESVEAVSAQRDKMISTVSHELRTPLAAVVGYTSLIADPSVDLSNPQNQAELREFAAAAATQATYLGRIIADMVAVSRGLFSDITPELMFLGTAAHDIVEAFRLKDLKIGLMVEDPGPVSADPARVSQIINNLVNNASLYGHGEILIQVGTTPTHSFVTVHDNGDGVPLRYQDLIFNEFERGPHHLDSTQPGSGLGLAIARRLAEAHGGSLTYSPSHLLGGAGFTLWLPKTEVPSPPDPLSAEVESMVETSSNLHDDLPTGCPADLPSPPSPEPTPSL